MYFPNLLGSYFVSFCQILPLPITMSASLPCKIDDNRKIVETCWCFFVENIFSLG